MQKSLVLKSTLTILITIIFFQSCNTSKSTTEETINIGPAKNQTNNEMSNIYESIIPSTSPSASTIPTELPIKTPLATPVDKTKTYTLQLSVKSGKGNLYLTYTDDKNGSFLFNFENINDSPSKIQLLDQYGNIIIRAKALVTSLTGNIFDNFSKQDSQKISKVQLFFNNSNMIEDIITDNILNIAIKPTPVSPIPIPTPRPTPTNTPSPSDNWNVTTIAGNGTSGFADGVGNSAKFYELRGIVLDSNGNIFVTDSYNNKIRKITSTGVVTTFAGSSVGDIDGVGEESQFNNPIGIGIDSYNNLYIADSNNYKIKKITPTRIVTTFAGSSFGDFDGIGITAKFGLPTGLSLDSYGNVYVSDFHNQKIKKISQSGAVTTIAGSGSYGSKNGTAFSSEFAYPYGVTVDKYGNVYVSDSSNNSIRKIDTSGNVSNIAGGTEGYIDGVGMSAKFNYPTGLVVDSNGVIFVADSNNSTIRKVLYNGTVTTIAGSGELGVSDGIGTIAKFFNPIGITTNKAGNLFIADNNKIRKIVSN